MALVIVAQPEVGTLKAKVSKQYIFLICGIASLGGVLFGFDLVTISGAIPFLSDHFHLNDFEKGWAVGCINLGCVLGSLLGGRLSEIWGRKKMLIVCSVLFSVTGVGTGWADSFDMYILFRMLSGISVGAAALVCPMYIAEISPTHLRGRMVSFYQLAITIGILLAYLSNYFLLNTGQDNWRWMFTAQSIPALLFFAGLFLVAESPRWLIRKNRVAEAKKILSKIGGDCYAESQLKIISDSYSYEVKGRFDEVFKKKMLPILLIGILIAFFSQAVGQNSLFSYAPEIFKYAGMGEETAFIQSFVIGVFNLLFTFFAILFVDKVGRKKLLKLGSILLFIDSFLLALAFYNQWSGFWTLVFVFAFIAVYASTIGPVTWVTLSEIFPNHVRGSAMAIATLVLWFTNFFSTAAFPVLMGQFGLPLTFIMHGSMCLIYFFIIQMKIPETKGKSLEEIEKTLAG